MDDVLITSLVVKRNCHRINLEACSKGHSTALQAEDSGHVRMKYCSRVVKNVQHVQPWWSFPGGKRFSHLFQGRVVRRMNDYGPGTLSADSRFHFLYFSDGG